ncbi:MAG: ABC transporter ATP-binding protein [Firmicutes bacterium]|nr:ABC transporter ATP-binding protein [Bacillota bacterium]
MDGQPAMQLRNLTKRVGKKTLVDHLTFDIPKGEVFGFLGPNGAGKTTTIRMMVGLMSISEGQVLIHGMDIEKQFTEAMRHIGCIVENPELYKYLTGYQNLRHMARMSKGVTEARIEEVVALVGLQNRMHDKVKTYSLGMRQRLGLAQALLHKPSILILDEPTNGLDPAGIRELRDHLRKLAREEDMAVIVSSHLLSEMELMCDRIAVIQNGKLIQVERMGDMGLSGVDEQTVAFEVDDASLAESVLAEHFQVAVQTSVDESSRLTLTLSREQVPEAVKLLTERGVRLYEVKAQRKSLEDTFLEMTGDESIA